MWHKSKYVNLWITKTFYLKYYKIEVNDESKETKCIQIVIREISNPSKKKTLLEFLKQILKMF